MAAGTFAASPPAVAGWGRSPCSESTCRPPAASRKRTKATAPAALRVVAGIVIVKVIGAPAKRCPAGPT